jgi:hypothetical protein
VIRAIREGAAGTRFYAGNLPAAQTAKERTVAIKTRCADRARINARFAGVAQFVVQEDLSSFADRQRFRGAFQAGLLKAAQAGNGHIESGIFQLGDADARHCGGNRTRVK